MAARRCADRQPDICTHEIIREVVMWVYDWQLKSSCEKCISEVFLVRVNCPFFSGYNARRCDKMLFVRASIYGPNGSDFLCVSCIISFSRFLDLHDINRLCAKLKRAVVAKCDIKTAINLKVYLKVCFGLITHLSLWESKIFEVNKRRNKQLK